MRYLIPAARILLGLAFTVSGLSFFFHLVPKTPPPPAAGAFAGAMLATGYLFQLLKTVEVVSGLLLLSGFFVPLALTFLAPVLVNILFFHAFLAPAGILPALVLLVLEVFLAWAYRDAFAPMLKAKTLPKL
jgi:putative oxidoreductase